MTSSLRIVPGGIARETTAISCWHCSGPLCVCAVLPALPKNRWRRSTKKSPASLAPLTCHGQGGPLCSHFQPLSFSSHLPLSHALSEVSSLYWMVQEQNHKPISVTPAMRLDGPNLSPSGAMGSTPVSLKRPFSPRQRGRFLFGDNCN